MLTIIVAGASASWSMLRQHAVGYLEENAELHCVLTKHGKIEVPSAGSHEILQLMLTMFKSHNGVSMSLPPPTLSMKDYNRNLKSRDHIPTRQAQARRRKRTNGQGSFLEEEYPETDGTIGTPLTLQRRLPFSRMSNAVLISSVTSYS